MCKNIRKNEDKPPAFLLYYYQKFNLKIKNPLRGQKERKTGSRYNDKLNTYDYILYRLKIKELSLFFC